MIHENFRAKFQNKSQLYIKNPLKIPPKSKVVDIPFKKNDLKVWEVSKILERKIRGQVLAPLIACSPDSDKEVFHVRLLKTVLSFLTNRAAQLCSRGIAEFSFSREFHVNRS